MLSFKLFFTEKKFANISSSEKKQAQDFINNFRKTYNTEQKLLKLKRKLDKTGDIMVSPIDVFDKETQTTKQIKVYVSTTEDAYAAYYDDYNGEPSIILNFYLAAGIEPGYESPIYAISSLQHELRHAVQELKVGKPGYYAHLDKTHADHEKYKDLTHYFLDKIELEPQQLELMLLIKNQYEEILKRSPQEIKILLPRFRLVLHNFLDSPWESAKNSLPKSFYFKYGFLNTLARSPSKWKAFKQKLYNFIQLMPGLK